MSPVPSYLTGASDKEKAALQETSISGGTTNTANISPTLTNSAGADDNVQAIFQDTDTSIVEDDGQPKYFVADKKFLHTTLTALNPSS